MTRCAVDLDSLLAQLAGVPPLQLQGTALLTQASPPLEALTAATLELVEYTDACQLLLQYITGLGSTPLHLPLPELGL